MKPLARTVLFMPGDSLHKIERATELPVDCVVLDLEDGVALGQKAAARVTVVDALQTLDFGSRTRLIRVNPPGTSLFGDDVRATIAARPDGYVLPKVSEAEQVQTLSLLLDRAEQAHGWPTGSIRIWAVIETARGIMNLNEIARSSPRLDALLFGAEDLAGDMGAIRTPEASEVFYARSAVVTAAAAYSLLAIDMVHFALYDAEGLALEAKAGRGFGYHGKMVIHPRQVEIVNRTFTPSGAEVKRAQRIVDAHRQQQAGGVGAFELDGRMIDMPVVRAAEELLERARQCQENTTKN